MTAPLRRIAVLGSGVMGSGIAALAANAGAEVTLLDIIPAGETNRNALAEKAIAKQLATGGFTHPSNAARVRAGNVEDLQGIAEADWIIEAVLEKLEVKHAVYQKIHAARKAGSIVSSNTSTIPLHDLTAPLGEAFARDFMIAHFFNPPRHMRLLEVVKSHAMDSARFQAVCAFADEALGKQVVACKDTPGFIANRIGVFWMVCALLEAVRLGIAVEDADALMGRAAGIPKTGVFGLYDLIGIDLIPLIAKSLLSTLPEGDVFRTLYREPEFFTRMIQEGYTGRKGKGGFYRVTKNGAERIKEVLDFNTGAYRPQGAAILASAKAKTLAELVNAPDAGGQFAWSVLSQTIAYSASLLPEIADDIVAVDTAMRAGYSWQFGPFEWLDQIGASAFAARMQQEGRAVPAYISHAAGKALYPKDTSAPRYLDLRGQYAPVPRTPGHLWLADIKRVDEPADANASARLWDIGDGIACLEYTTKMNSTDMNVLAFLEQVVARVQRDFRGLVIGNDTPQFCVGANLNLFLDHARSGEWHAISDLILRGQGALMGLKYAPFPVVASLAGLALGGGCELALHADAVQAHMECTAGLVEAGVGLLPAWGGSKEMLLRHADPLAAFTLIAEAKTCGSAQEARDMHIVRENGGISMNRARVLADAKTRCLALVAGYKAPAPMAVPVGGAAAKQRMLDALAAMNLPPHGLVIGRVVAHVLSGGEKTGTVPEAELLSLEHEGFMELIRTTASQERIAHMLKTGKPLGN